MAWCFLGLVIMGFAFRVTDAQWGRILLSLVLVGYAGMVVTLGRAYLRAEERRSLTVVDQTASQRAPGRGAAL